MRALRSRKPNAPAETPRVPVGIWAQWPRGARWSNEGMTRLVGFLIEGIAKEGTFMFRLVLPDWIRDEAEQDLQSLEAVAGRDYTLHSPRDAGWEAEDFPQLVEYANAEVPVEGWLSIFPTFDFAAGLEKPLAVIFPDAIPKTFHEYSDLAWGPVGNHFEWERKVRGLVTRADRLVTFSEHVRDEHVGRLFDIPASKVSVVPHAQPDLAPALPFVHNRTRTAKSLRKAGDLLRAHARQRGWGYLQDYPFEQAPYVAVSTQDRVTKNVRLIVDAALRATRKERRDLKIFSTAPLHFGADWTPLPSYIEQHLALRDIVSVPDLPRVEHAAFYHCAEVAVHASIFEGGHAPFPFSEAVSVGTPCLMANGPHVAELVASEPNLAPFVFDPNDADGLAALIGDTIDRREEVLAVQREVFERVRRRSWADVAAAYARAAVEGSVGQ
jgi:glycosyltransferase involved in cell wall biosynthesis